jgi:hypothetical protein
MVKRRPSAISTRYGWAAVNEIVFPVLIAAGLLFAWASFSGRPEPV